jgi:flagellar protein FlgJ
MILPGVQAVGTVAGLKALPEGVESVKQAAEEFEAYLIQLLLKEMRNTIPDGGMGGGGIGRDVFQAISDQSLATTMAKTGGIGLAQALIDDAIRRTGFPSSFEGKRPIGR